MNKKNYFQQLCEMSYSCNLMNHGFMPREDMRRHRHLDK